MLLNTNELKELTGTEKQVAWANDIRLEAINTINHNYDILIEKWEKYFDRNPEAFLMTDIRAWEELAKQIKKILDSTTTAKEFIEKRHLISSRQILNKHDMVRNLIKNGKM